MGAWGIASDQNDGVWDCVPFGGLELRMNGLGPLDIVDHKAMASAVREANPKGLNAGVVVWLLKLGCGLNKEELQTALKEMVEELESNDSKPRFPDRKDERATVLHDEIKMVQGALQNDDGYAKDEYLIGTFGIFRANLKKADGTPFHEQVHRAPDGKLVLANSTE